MQVEYFDISGPFLVTPQTFVDERGTFTETFRTSDLNELAGETLDFVQENVSRSTSKGTLRGLHFQLPPAAQGKLVRCAKGKILDVAVDLRRDSDSYGQHMTAELDASLAQSLWVPSGFAHGFVTLEAGCEVVYKVTATYAPKLDRGLFWADPDLAINWGMNENQVLLSEKDQKAGRFADFDSPF